jgi:DNA invertase Pin-like site-specific DNA recombinase
VLHLSHPIEGGWRVIETYTDRVSGGKQSRPALDRMLADARRGRFDVFRFDRLSRSTLHFLQVIEELRTMGVDFVSHEQSLDTTTAMGKFVLTMFAAISELERQVIRERVQAGIKHAKRHGTKSGRPIGRPRRVFDRAQIEQLRAQGLGLRDIARKLNVGYGTVCRAAGEEVATDPKPSR